MSPPRSSAGAPALTDGAAAGFRGVAAQSRPRMRPDGLTFVQIDRELLIYDEHTYRSHRLEEAAAALFRACDGSRTCAELADALALPESVVDALLVVLAADDLLVDVALREAHSRRAFLESWARHAVGGLVVSLLVPSAAQAASCISIGFPSGGIPCCPGLIRIGGICLSIGG